MDKKDLSSIFERNVPGSTEILQKSCVGIAGCGGLGSNAAVALTRAGVGRLIIADFDKVELSNLNRQHYFLPDIDRQKVEALSSHLKEINSAIEIISHDLRISAEMVKEVYSGADLLIEAFDHAECKHWLIEAWCASFPDKDIICGSGVSGLGDSASIGIRSSGRIHIIGDEQTSSEVGLCAARVGLAANMQANLAIEILTRAGGIK